MRAIPSLSARAGVLTLACVVSALGFETAFALDPGVFRAQLEATGSGSALASGSSSSRAGACLSTAELHRKAIEFCRTRCNEGTKKCGVNTFEAGPSCERHGYVRTAQWTCYDRTKKTWSADDAVEALPNATNDLIFQSPSGNGRPDYVVGDLVLTPMSPVRGQPFTIAVKVTNKGGWPTGATTGTLQIDENNDGNGLWRETTTALLPAIKPGGYQILQWSTANKRLHWKMPVGVHRLIICVNRNNAAFLESVTTNNCEEKVITVRPAGASSSSAALLCPAGCRSSSSSSVAPSAASSSSVPGALPAPYIVTVGPLTMTTPENKPVSPIKAGQKVMAHLTVNGLLNSLDHNAVLLFDVRDARGVTQSLQWQDIALPAADEGMTTTFYWTPLDAGVYSIRCSVHPSSASARSFSPVAVFSVRVY
jgi:hypothetical protein